MHREPVIDRGSRDVEKTACPNSNRSAIARRRLLGVRHEPLFLADWLDVVFLHFEVDGAALQQEVPFELERWQGSAYVSLVAFTMRGMRPRRGGRLTEWLLKPIATHRFLNVRTYVRHRGETGIHFLAEWLDNRISVLLGPVTFGLPYRFGRLDYKNDAEDGRLMGRVSRWRRDSPRLEYRARIDPTVKFGPCAAGSLDGFLLERYTAFNGRVVQGGWERGGVPDAALKRFFRIWHPPWPQVPIGISALDISLLKETWPWFGEARLVSAHYSPGVRDVWMGRPQRC